MEIAKWVILLALAGLVIWLLVDTIILWVKKRKAKKTKQLENETNNNDKKES